MIPLRDENPSGSVPGVTVGFIVLNCAVFVYEILLGPDLRDFMLSWGLVPARLTLALQAGQEPVTAAALTALTSMFLHGGWVHLIGNMWYLWIFGDNIEDRLGSARFVAFYLLGGLVAAAIQYLTGPTARQPMVGASGAIAAVLGAYAVAYPRARVMTLLPLFPFIQIVPLPAVIVLGLWFVYQLLVGTLSLAGGAQAGVAWWAHIGGFAFGMLAVRVMTPRSRRLSRAWAE